ncbi:FHA domain-containing protein [uncultured Gimesia sp.]|uniref:FHA domain-containing protein n=1 Tax=uncultured Gimesia sp. TaxID=1678688 RepID=UPI0026320763|nr:FHA domain-containing protein [uncultured Gimesia sp.]
MKIQLSIQSPSQSSKPLTLTQTTLVGRGSDCDLKLKSELVSRHHCKIFLTDSVAIVHDLGSSNGTFIDGQKLTPKRDTKLATGCLLSIADVNFRIDYDNQEILDPGSTIFLKGIEDILPTNSHIRTPDKAVEIKLPEESAQSKTPEKPEKHKASETVTIEEYIPDHNNKQNNRTVEYPEIELDDKMEEK